MRDIVLSIDDWQWIVLAIVAFIGVIHIITDIIATEHLKALVELTDHELHAIERDAKARHKDIVCDSVSTTAMEHVRERLSMVERRLELLIEDVNATIDSIDDDFDDVEERLDALEDKPIRVEVKVQGSTVPEAATRELSEVVNEWYTEHVAEHAQDNQE